MAERAVAQPDGEGKGTGSMVVLWTEAAECGCISDAPRYTVYYNWKTFCVLLKVVYEFENDV